MRYVVLALFLFSFTSCQRYYHHIIESDYSYDGRFNRYKTFKFVANSQFAGDEELQSYIEKYLNQNLEFWGYKEKDRNPSLLIFYNLYLEDVDFKGFTQPDFEQWVTQNFGDDIIDREQMEKIYLENRERIRRDNEVYNQHRYNLKDGTILITFYDPKKSKTVWQGYASGVLDTSQGPGFENERIIRHIVSRILHKYRVLSLSNS